MFFTAPDFWRKREHRSVLSFCWKVIFLLHIFGLSFHGSLFAEEKALLEFSDNDSRGGWLSGDLIITVPDKVIPAKISGKISKFVLHWGNNPNKRLGRFRPVVEQTAAMSRGRMPIRIKGSRATPGAKHFLLYARQENGEETETCSRNLSD